MNIPQINEGERAQKQLAKDIKVNVYTGTDLLNMEIKEIPKLWDPFFPVCGLVGFTGSSDCGKSMFLRQFAIAVSLSQKEFLGYPLRLKYSSAIYVCTEDDVDGVAANMQCQIGNADWNRVSGLRFLFDTQNLNRCLDEMLTKAPADLVVLDVWSDTFSGNPNNWVDVRQNLSPLKELARKHNCLIVLLHHTIKNSEKNAPDKNRLNGSQAIEAKLRSLLELRNGTNNDERLLFVLKSNYMPRGQKEEGMVLKINPKWLLFENTGKKISLSAQSNGNKAYDPAVWWPRMKELRAAEGLSFEKAQKALADKFGEDSVPGITWFKKQEKIQ